MRRIAERLEIHYTPKHGSWLNMAEIEIGAMVGPCLNRRLPDRESYAVKSMLGRKRRNREAVRVDWRFTTADARIKLKSLYPSIQSDALLVVRLPNVFTFNSLTFSIDGVSCS